jgi:hypothetical protein
VIRFCSNILFLFYNIFNNLFIKIINLVNDDCVLVKKKQKKKRGRFDMYSVAATLSSETQVMSNGPSFDRSVRIRLSEASLLHDSNRPCF